MAVTLTAATLGAAIRTAGTPAENTEVARLLIYATEAVTQHVPTAPDAVHDEAVIRLAAWLYDQPNVGRGEAFAGALRKSGAAAILLPYRIIGAGTTGEAVALAVNAGTADNPVVRVAIADGVLTVTYADATTEDYDLPAGMGGAGQAVAVNVVDGRLPAPPVVMRLGWAQVLPFRAVEFNRVDDHPIDGAAVGLTTPGVDIPPFPPALVGEETLHLGVWIAGDAPVVALTIFSDDGLYLFPTREALTVDGVPGYVYVLSFRSAPAPEGQENLVIVELGGGALLLTDADVPDWARTGDDTPIPAPKLTLAPGGGDGGDGVDQVARAAAMAAGAAAMGAQDTADANAATLDTKAAAAGLDNVTMDGPQAAAFRALLNLPDGQTVSVGGTAPTDPAAGDLWIADLHNDIVVIRERVGTAWVDRLTLTEHAQRRLLYAGTATATAPGTLAVAVADLTGDLPAGAVVSFAVPDPAALTGTATIAVSVNGAASFTITTAAGAALTVADLTAGAVWLAYRQTATGSAVLLSAAGAPSTVAGAGTGGGGGSGAWYWAASSASVGEQWTADAFRDLSLRTFPVGPYATYQELRTAVSTGGVKQIAIRIADLDADGADEDQGTFVIPIASGFTFGGFGVRVYPGWTSDTDPVGFELSFGAASMQIRSDTAIAAAAQVYVRVAVWA